MLLKGLYHNFYLRIAVFILLTIAGTYLVLQQEWVWFVPILSVWSFFLRLVLLSDKRNAQKVAFMFDAIDNSDYAFRYATRGRSSNDKLVSESLNRITQILFQAKADAAQKEKYYELIMNCVNTGIIVLDDNGVIYQTNNEALRLLGLAVFTNVRQLARIDENLKTVIQNIQPGDKHQISFTNERGNVHLSIRVSEMTLQDKHVRILAINDINSELDDKEIDSWIRLTRVLTHEIMNSVTPITSLSDTLLSLHQNADDEIRNGLEVISTTGKSLISFVESYRKFTHIPTPRTIIFSAECRPVVAALPVRRRDGNFCMKSAIYSYLCALIGRRVGTLPANVLITACRRRSCASAAGCITERISDAETSQHRHHRPCRPRQNHAGG